MNNRKYHFLIMVSAALGASLSLPVAAETGGSGEVLVLEEVIVTARRREEMLQDVPVSMTVFNQRQLDDANIINAGDLAAYTPSLQSNTRFGADNTTFAIRGFSQELRTTASVGVYFAEVIAPRGANSQQSGDGAGPGDFFDLQNVQVLKGPQGTLFGRNTTGGAVLLTPQRPTDELEGYLEVSAGNFDMWRSQGVLNLPVSDSVRLRFGVDHQERDGYLDNFSGIGPDKFADLEYTAVRASAVINFSPSLENYTILRWFESENNGYPTSLVDCNPEAGLLGNFCAADLAERIATGTDDLYDVYSFVPEPVNDQEQWQLINSTTWDISDTLIIRNILSYAELETRQRSSIYGTNWQYPTGAAVTDQLIFQQVGLTNSFNTTDQRSYVWELQFQGNSFNDKLEWQAGLYYEKSEPVDDYGAQSPTFVSCIQSTIVSTNPADFRCNNLLAPTFGALQSTPGGVDYTNQAAYAQGTWRFSSRVSATAGIRYTNDDTKGYSRDRYYYFDTLPAQQYSGIDDSRTIVDDRSPSQHSEEPTWLLGVDYTPTDDLLLYAKYARGYRQGSINLGGLTGLDVHGPEEVDTYEIGSKFTFSGEVAGTLNVAAFYNDFTDQQIQYGYFKPTGTGTTAVINAGSSTLWGVEVETVLQLHENFLLNASYAYLDTEVDKLVLPPFPPDIPNVLATLNTTTAEGEPLSYAPENELVLTGTFLVPVSPEVGDMTLSVSFLYTDEQQAVAKDVSIYSVLPDRELWNANLNWNRILGSNFDLSLFGTNLTDEEYITYLTGNWNNGLEVAQVGIPRMYGMRIRYNFGIGAP